MKELSIFIDESGDFVKYDHHSPFYIISMVFHDQSSDISDPLKKLEDDLSHLGLFNHCVHTGPIIRRENEYKYLGINERRRILNCMTTFVKHIDVRYHCIHVEKAHLEDTMEIVAQLSKQISSFIKENYQALLAFDKVKIYYDNGQHEISRILVTVFSALLPSVTIKRVVPSDYRLFQVADFLCSMELVKLKVASSSVSSSEMEFFGNLRDMKKNYIRQLERKEWK